MRNAERAKKKKGEQRNEIECEGSEGSEGGSEISEAQGSQESEGGHQSSEAASADDRRFFYGFLDCQIPDYGSRGRDCIQRPRDSGEAICESDPHPDSGWSGYPSEGL